MCLYLKRPSQKKPNVAKKSIKCWKVLDITSRGSLISRIYNFRYKLGKLYGKRKLTVDYDGNSIESGFHSYTHKRRAINYLGHASFMTAIVECRIPRRSKYYLGRDSEMVSDQIIIKKILKTKKI